MYYDELTKTWFSDALDAAAYHNPDIAADVNAYQYELELCDEQAEEAAKDYDRMEERAGNYETGCDVLMDALYKIMSGQATTRAARNALRADLEERLPACMLEYAGMSALLRPERDARGRVA